MLAIQKIWRPDNLKEAWDIVTNLGRDNYCFVAGGTWLRTQWEAGISQLSANLISLENMKDMGQIKHLVLNGKHEVIIGSQVKLSECVKSEVLKMYVSPVVKACSNIAAPSIRNQATIGGNIFTKAGDTIPALLIEDAKLLWYNGKEVEEEGLEAWLITTNGMQEQRILVGVKVETSVCEEDDFSFYTKVGRRERFTASLVSVAGKGKVNSGGIMRNIRLAAGGAFSPTRLSNTELELEGRPISSSLQRVHQRIVSEIEANADPFATAAYQKTVAANLISSELYQVSNRSEGGGDRRVVKS